MNAKLTRSGCRASGCERSNVESRRAGDGVPIDAFAAARLYRVLWRHHVPLPWPRLAVLREEEVLARRALHCPCYEACLNTAVACGWTSWTCDNCPEFERPVRRGKDRVLV